MFPNLTTLHLKGAVHGASLPRIAQHLPQLQQLLLPARSVGFGQSYIRSLSALTGLTHLRLGFRSGYHDGGVDVHPELGVPSLMGLLPPAGLARDVGLQDMRKRVALWGKYGYWEPGGVLGMEQQQDEMVIEGEEKEEDGLKLGQLGAMQQQQQVQQEAEGPHGQGQQVAAGGRRGNVAGMSRWLRILAVEALGKLHGLMSPISCTVEGVWAVTGRYSSGSSSRRGGGADGLAPASSSRCSNQAGASEQAPGAAAVQAAQAVHVAAVQAVQAVQTSPAAPRAGVRLNSSSSTQAVGLPEAFQHLLLLPPSEMKAAMKKWEERRSRAVTIIRPEAAPPSLAELRAAAQQLLQLHPELVAVAAEHGQQLQEVAVAAVVTAVADACCTSMQLLSSCSSSTGAGGGGKGGGGGAMGQGVASTAAVAGEAVGMEKAGGGGGMQVGAPVAADLVKQLWFMVWYGEAMKRVVYQMLLLTAVAGEKQEEVQQAGLESRAAGGGEGGVEAQEYGAAAAATGVSREVGSQVGGASLDPRVAAIVGRAATAGGGGAAAAEGGGGTAGGGAAAAAARAAAGGAAAGGAAGAAAARTAAGGAAAGGAAVAGAAAGRAAAGGAARRGAAGGGGTSRGVRAEAAAVKVRSRVLACLPLLAQHVVKLWQVSSTTPTAAEEGAAAAAHNTNAGEGETGMGQGSTSSLSFVGAVQAFAAATASGSGDGAAALKVAASSSRQRSTPIVGADAFQSTAASAGAASSNKASSSSRGRSRREGLTEAAVPFENLRSLEVVGPLPPRELGFLTALPKGLRQLVVSQNPSWGTGKHLGWLVSAAYIKGLERLVFRGCMGLDKNVDLQERIVGLGGMVEVWVLECEEEDLGKRWWEGQRREVRVLEGEKEQERVWEGVGKVRGWEELQEMTAGQGDGGSAAVEPWLQNPSMQGFMPAIAAAACNIAGWGLGALEVLLAGVQVALKAEGCGWVAEESVQLLRQQVLLLLKVQRIMDMLREQAIREMEVVTREAWEVLLELERKRFKGRGFEKELEAFQAANKRYRQIEEEREREDMARRLEKQRRQQEHQQQQEQQMEWRGEADSGHDLDYENDGGEYGMDVGEQIGRSCGEGEQRLEVPDHHQQQQQGVKGLLEGQEQTEQKEWQQQGAEGEGLQAVEGQGGALEQQQQLLEQPLQENQSQRMGGPRAGAGSSSRPQQQQEEEECTDGREWLPSWPEVLKLFDSIAGKNDLMTEWHRQQQQQELLMQGGNDGGDQQQQQPQEQQQQQGQQQQVPGVTPGAVSAAEVVKTIRNVEGKQDELQTILTRLHPLMAAIDTADLGNELHPRRWEQWLKAKELLWQVVGVEAEVLAVGEAVGKMVLMLGVNPEGLGLLQAVAVGQQAGWEGLAEKLRRVSVGRDKVKEVMREVRRMEAVVAGGVGQATPHLAVPVPHHIPFDAGELLDQIMLDDDDGDDVWDEGPLDVGLFINA